MYGKLVGASDYQLNLHPPEEDTQDVLDSLDSVMAVSRLSIGSSQTVWGVVGIVRVPAHNACGGGMPQPCCQLEEVKRKGEEDDFVAAKQKMLNAEKGRIQ